MQEVFLRARGTIPGCIMKFSITTLMLFSVKVQVKNILLPPANFSSFYFPSLEYELEVSAKLSP